MSDGEWERLVCIHGIQEGLDSHDCPECQVIAEMCGYDIKKQTYIFTSHTIVKRELLIHATTKIKNVVCPEHWISGGTKQPSNKAKANAIVCCKNIFKDLEKMPFIACTIENGIYLKFQLNNKLMIIEAYNDGKICALISDNDKKSIIYNEDIKKFNFNNCIKKLQQ